MMSSDRCDPARMVRGLGTAWEVLGISLKPYPCCRWIHSTLDAVRELAAEHEIRPAEVRRVTVRSIEPVRAWFHARRPATMVDAEFSVPHAVAMTLLDRPRPAWWQPASRSDPDALALMDRVDLETDQAAQASYADGRDSARIWATVSIETARGTFERTRRHAGGSPDDPMTGGEIERKFRELAATVPGVSADRIIEAVDKLETLDSMAALGALLRPV
jgi:2-methylcitrate dehydratase PrpD